MAVWSSAVQIVVTSMFHSCFIHNTRLFSDRLFTLFLCKCLYWLFLIVWILIINTNFTVESVELRLTSTTSLKLFHSAKNSIMCINLHMLLNWRASKGASLSSQSICVFLCEHTLLSKGVMLSLLLGDTSHTFLTNKQGEQCNATWPFLAASHLCL